MVFKPRQKKQLFEFHVSIDEQTIPRVSETMFLGVFVDDNLSWKSHISLLASKLSKSIGIIHKSRFFLSTHSLSQIHNYNTRNAHSFRLPLCRTNTRLFSIYFQGPKFYNSLNSVITGSSSSASFKRKLKEFFLSMY